MMQRLVLVVNTGGSEGLSMVKGIRSAGVFCTMTDAARLDVPEEAKGVVVIGGPSEYARPCLRKLLDRQLPILAFGDPAARLCEELGGQVTGHAVTNQLRDVHFANLGVCRDVEGGMRMLQSAEYLSLPQGCRTLSVAEGVTLGFDDAQGRCTGFQFMPEAHDVEASEIIGNFLWNVLGLQPNYTFEGYIDQAVTRIRDAVGDGQAVCVLSGGVDSTAAACLAKRAVGDRLHCLVIEKGLGRKGELECIQQVLGGELGLDYRLIQAQGRVMEQLRNCVTPSQKRQAVEQFIADRISDEVARLGGHVVVVKGTNYTELLGGEDHGRLAGGHPGDRAAAPAVQGRGPADRGDPGRAGDRGQAPALPQRGHRAALHGRRGRRKARRAAPGGGNPARDAGGIRAEQALHAGLCGPGGLLLRVPGRRSALCRDPARGQRLGRGGPSTSAACRRTCSSAQRSAS